MNDLGSDDTPLSVLVDIPESLSVCCDTDRFNRPRKQEAPASRLGLLPYPTDDGPATPASVRGHGRTVKEFDMQKRSSHWVPSYLDERDGATSRYALTRLMEAIQEHPPARLVG